MIVLGLKCYSHDTGAAIITDRAGKLEIIAISEARLNRRKHSFTYPLLAIDYCLDAMGLRGLSQVDAICIDRHMEIWPESRSQFGYDNALRRHQPRYDDNHRWNYLVEQTINFDRSRMHLVNHVDAHAASAYFASPYGDAAVLIAEGGAGIYHGKKLELGVIDRYGYMADSYAAGSRTDPRRDNFVNSSFFYDRVSELLGYDIFGAGQTMALAGFADQFPRTDQVSVDEDRFDGIFINHDKTVFGMLEMAGFAEEDAARLISESWVNLARQAQETLEADVMHLVRLARERTKSPNLCLAGGAALNCIINGHIKQSGLFDGLFIQPAASDEGIPLGCALWGYYAMGGKRRWEMTRAYLGRPNHPGDLQRGIRKYHLEARPAENAELARMLAEGKILGRISGASEYGPRALGNRSILADPRPAGMKDRLNAEIKHREGFRPFAPSCLADRQPDFIDGPAQSPFMIIAGSVRQDSLERVPAVTHADGSCRVQTVTHEQNPDYYDLIQAFGDLTGCFLLLNTSFNDQGEPIVETYEDAISCFLRTGLDALIVEDKLIERSEKTPPLDADAWRAQTMERTNQTYNRMIEKYCNPVKYVDLATKLRSGGG